MNDLDLLEKLNKELTETLKERAKQRGYNCNRKTSINRIRRLRLQIQEVMLRIEKGLSFNVSNDKYLKI